MNGAQFIHDCDKCEFISHWKGCDVYRCSQGGTIPTIVARFSSDGPDYSSGKSVVLPGLTLQAT